LKKLLTQRGDTLVEVTIALAIMGTVLVLAFNLVGLAFRTGLMARERSQAINLLQEQAEALRHYRNSRSWSNFTSGVNAAGPAQFHMRRNGSSWVPTAGPWHDASAVPEIFRTGGSRLFITVSGSGDSRFVQLTAEWSGAGGGAERTSVTTRLVNLDGMAPR
jgi:prepilin-type N-terminal cleavage/methylation domain-containing protein